MNRTMIVRGVSCALILSFLLFGLAMPARALGIRSGETVIIAEGEVVDDDLIAAAETIIVDGTIKGDLLAAGQSIVIGPKGVVEGDLLGAGQIITISGKIQDDARIAGMTLLVERDAMVGDDVIAAGYSLETKPGSQIGGTLIVGAFQSLLAGEITGDVQAGVAGLELQGRVGGSVLASVASADDSQGYYPRDFGPGVPAMPTVKMGLTIGPEAKIAGNLDYRTTKEITIPAGVVLGKTTFTYDETVGRVESEPEVRDQEREDTPAGWLGKVVRLLVTLLIVGLLLAWLMPGMLHQGAATLHGKPWWSLLWGALSYPLFGFGMLALGLLVLLLAVIFGGLTLGSLMWLTLKLGFFLFLTLVLGFSILTGFVAKIVVGYWLGNLLLHRIKPESNVNRFAAVALGMLFVGLLASIPFVGGLINLLIIVAGLGALALLAYAYFKPAAA